MSIDVNLPVRGGKEGEMVQAHKGPGEGTVGQRSDGRYQAALMVNGNRRYVYGKTQAEVKAKLKVLQGEAHRNGTLSNPGTKTLNDLLDAWLAVSAPVLKPRTLHDYQEITRRYVRQTIGKVRLSKLAPETLQGLYSDLMSKGLERAPSQVHSILHRALKMAVMWGWIASNPADRVLKPEYRADRKDVWSVEDLQRFLDSTSSNRHGPLFTFLSCTGVRVGEALGLRWEDVDVAAGTAAIHRNMQRIGAEWVEQNPKTVAGERVITLPLAALAALKRQKALLAALRIKAGPDWADRNLVFPGVNGDPVCTSTIHRALTRACDKIGLSPVGPHQLRHLHASLLLSRGLPVTSVSARLGHASPNITMTIYAHAMKQQDQQAAAMMQEVLGG